MSKYGRRIWAALASGVVTGATFVGASSPAWAAATVPPTINGVVYVANAAELEYLDQNYRAYQSASIDLTADINLSGFNWVPWSSFSGTLNGNGYTIKDLTCSNAPTYQIGLIGSLTGGTVENLGLVNPSMTGTNVVDEGAVVALGESGSLTHVYVQGGAIQVQSFYYSGPNNVGGLIGLQDGTTLTDVYSSATVSLAPGVSASGQNVGGLIGAQAGTVSGGVDDTTTTPAYPAAGLQNPNDTASIVSASTSQMQQSPSDQTSVYSGWNFSTVWTQSAGSFPALQSTPPTVPSLTAHAGTGTTAGTTAITATPNTSGDTLVVQVNATAPAPVALGATPPSGATAYTSGTNIANVAPGDVVTLYEVSNGGAVAAASQFTLTAGDIKGALGWTPPVLTSEPVTVDGVSGQVIGNFGYNPPSALQHGTFVGYVEERAAVEAGASFIGEGTDSAYLSAILDGSGVGLQQHVSAVQQGQFAALYQKLGIIPTWTNNTVSVPQSVAALVTAGAPMLAIENYLVQLDGFSWAAATAQGAAGFPMQSGT